MASRNCEALQNVCRSRAISTAPISERSSFFTNKIRYCFVPSFPLSSVRRVVVIQIHSETRLVLHIKRIPR